MTGRLIHSRALIQDLIVVYYDQPLNFREYVPPNRTVDVAFNGTFGCFRITLIENIDSKPTDFLLDSSKISVTGYPPHTPDDPHLHTFDIGNWVPYATRPAVNTMAPAGKSTIPYMGGMVFKIQVSNERTTTGDLLTSDQRFMLQYDDRSRHVLFLKRPSVEPGVLDSVDPNTLALQGI